MFDTHTRAHQHTTKFQGRLGFAGGQQQTIEQGAIVVAQRLHKVLNTQANNSTTSNHTLVILQVLQGFTFRRLGLGQPALVQAFRRMVFSLATVNYDDHLKNFAFLMDPQGRWTLSPAYDVAYAENDGWTRQHRDYFCLRMMVSCYTG